MNRNGDRVRVTRPRVSRRQGEICSQQCRVQEQPAALCARCLAVIASDVVELRGRKIVNVSPGAVGPELVRNQSLYGFDLARIEKVDAERFDMRLRVVGTELEDAHVPLTDGGNRRTVLRVVVRVLPLRVKD